MRRLLLPALALAALCVGSIASAAPTATKLVKITRSAFNPTRVSIATGDAVKWTNTDSVNHQVVSNNGSFVSPVLAPGRSYTHRFNASGTYRYHDGLHPALTGRVVVSGPPPAVTLGASNPVIIFGQTIFLSGQISTKEANQRITIWAQPYGQASFVQLGTVLTATNGFWQLTGVAPRILTTYQARWQGRVSQNITVAVQPRIKFAKITRGRFGVHVYAATSYSGHWVYIQRLSRFGQWVAVRKVTLGSNSGRAFRLRLPRGISRLRAFMTVNQAGPGYFNGISPTIRVRRR
jgi:plastocyanin